MKRMVPFLQVGVQEQAPAPLAEQMNSYQKI
jgi:hypothetical protein